MWLYSSLQWTGSIACCDIDSTGLDTRPCTPASAILRVCSLLFLSVCAQDLALAQQVLSENAGDADLAIVELLQLMDLGPGI